MAALPSLSLGITNTEFKQYKLGVFKRLDTFIDLVGKLRLVESEESAALTTEPEDGEPEDGAPEKVDAYKEGKKFIVGLWSIIYKTVKSMFNKFLKALDDIIKWVKNLWNAIKNFFKNLIKSIVGKIKVFVGKFKAFIKATVGKIKGLIQDFKNIIKPIMGKIRVYVEKFSKLIKSISGLWNKLVTWFTTKLPVSLANIGKSIARHVVDKLQIVGKWALSILDDILRFMKIIATKALELAKMLASKVLSGLSGLKAMATLAAARAAARAAVPAVAATAATLTKSEITALIKKRLGNSLGKIIPGLGLALGAYDAYARAMKGDVAGAALAATGGAAGLFPGIGTGVAIAALAANIARDVYKAAYGVFPEADAGDAVANNLKSIMDETIELLTGKPDLKIDVNKEKTETLNAALSAYAAGWSAGGGVRKKLTDDVIKAATALKIPNSVILDDLKKIREQNKAADDGGAAQNLQALQALQALQSLQEVNAEGIGAASPQALTANADNAASVPSAAGGDPATPAATPASAIGPIYDSPIGPTKNYDAKMNEYYDDTDSPAATVIIDNTTTNKVVNVNNYNRLPPSFPSQSMTFNPARAGY